MPLEFDYDETGSKPTSPHDISGSQQRMLLGEWAEGAHRPGAGDMAHYSEARPEGHPPDGADPWGGDPHGQGDPRMGKANGQEERPRNGYVLDEEYEKFEMPDVSPTSPPRNGLAADAKYEEKFEIPERPGDGMSSTREKQWLGQWNGGY